MASVNTPSTANGHRRQGQRPTVVSNTELVRMFHEVLNGSDHFENVPRINLRSGLLSLSAGALKVLKDPKRKRSVEDAVIYIRRDVLEIVTKYGDIRSTQELNGLCNLLREKIPYLKNLLLSHATLSLQSSLQLYLQWARSSIEQRFALPDVAAPVENGREKGGSDGRENHEKSKVTFFDLLKEVAESDEPATMCRSLHSHIRAAIDAEFEKMLQQCKEERSLMSEGRIDRLVNTYQIALDGLENLFRESVVPQTLSALQERMAEAIFTPLRSHICKARRMQEMQQMCERDFLAPLEQSLMHIVDEEEWLLHILERNHMQVQNVKEHALMTLLPLQHFVHSVKQALQNEQEGSEEHASLQELLDEIQPFKVTDEEIQCILFQRASQPTSMSESSWWSTIASNINARFHGGLHFRSADDIKAAVIRKDAERENVSIQTSEEAAEIAKQVSELVARSVPLEFTDGQRSTAKVLLRKSNLQQFDSSARRAVLDELMKRESLDVGRANFLINVTIPELLPTAPEIVAAPDVVPVTNDKGHQEDLGKMRHLFARELQAGAPPSEKKITAAVHTLGIAWMKRRCVERPNAGVVQALLEELRSESVAAGRVMQEGSLVEVSTSEEALSEAPKPEALSHATFVQSMPFYVKREYDCIRDFLQDARSRDALASIYLSQQVRKRVHKGMLAEHPSLLAELINGIIRDGVMPSYPDYALRRFPSSSGADLSVDSTQEDRIVPEKIVAPPAESHDESLDLGEYTSSLVSDTVQPDPVPEEQECKDAHLGRIVRNEIHRLIEEALAKFDCVIDEIPAVLSDAERKINAFRESTQRLEHALEQLREYQDNVSSIVRAAQIHVASGGRSFQAFSGEAQWKLLDILERVVELRTSYNDLSENLDVLNDELQLARKAALPASLQQKNVSLGSLLLLQFAKQGDQDAYEHLCAEAEKYAAVQSELEKSRSTFSEVNSQVDDHLHFIGIGSEDFDRTFDVLKRSREKSESNEKTTEEAPMDHRVAVAGITEDIVRLAEHLTPLQIDVLRILTADRGMQSNFENTCQGLSLEVLCASFGVLGTTHLPTCEDLLSAMSPFIADGSHLPLHMANREQRAALLALRKGDTLVFQAKASPTTSRLKFVPTFRAFALIRALEKQIVDRHTVARLSALLKSSV